MWLLEQDGTLAEGQAPAALIEGEDHGFVPSDARTPLAVRFSATQDGRGFSTARLLRARGHEGRLVAVGPLEPDQARHAFQCGFDAVGIENETLERHGRSAWANALKTSVGALYVTDPTARVATNDIWAARHGSRT